MFIFLRDFISVILLAAESRTHYKFLTLIAQALWDGRRLRMKGDWCWLSLAMKVLIFKIVKRENYMCTIDFTSEGSLTLSNSHKRYDNLSWLHSPAWSREGLLPTWKICTPWNLIQLSSTDVPILWVHIVSHGRQKCLFFGVAGLAFDILHIMHWLYLFSSIAHD